MNYLSLSALAFLVLALTNVTHARGGEGGMRGGGDFGGGEFRGDDEFRDDAVEDGGFRGEAPRLDGNFDPAVRNDANIQRTGGDSYRINADGDTATVRGDGDGVANVNVRTVNGVNYDAAVVGPDGFRNGYVWRNGAYVAVNCDPWVPYVVPFGSWAGWSIVTQPDFVQYPVYSTYPIETAVEVALQKLGLYSGPIDGLAASCAGAIEQYQMQNGMPVTGTITPELLTALGIQANIGQ
ncbi:MAG: peptidoglycan-binding domain-containing protein [Chthoniobacterales bacterium]